MKKELSEAISNLEKQYGKGIIRELGSTDKLDVSVIPSGSLAVDVALGVGGFPRGRIVEIYGPESGGKTTLTLHLIAQAQKLGGTAAFIDAEHALDPSYAKALGIDIDHLLVCQPDSGEQALEIAEGLIKSNSVDIVVIDSVAALVPRSELEGEMGQAQMGVMGRMMSQALRKLTAITSKSQTSLVFINQIRDKIGVLYGSPETTSGGRALKFFSSIRIDIRRISTNKVDDIAVSNKTKIKVVKNKLAAPFKEAEVELVYGKGINNEADIINYGVEKGLIEKSGSWYSYKKERIGQGMDNACDFLRMNPEISENIEKELRKLYFGGE
jgi:recombination protein RecA